METRLLVGFDLAAAAALAGAVAGADRDESGVSVLRE